MAIVIPGAQEPSGQFSRFRIPGDAASEAYVRDLGWRLRVHRRGSQLSLGAVERATGGDIKGSVLGAYERGERSISARRLWELSVFFGVAMVDLLPFGGSVPRSRMAEGDVRLIIRPDPVRIATGPEAAVLQRFVGKLQVEKMNFHGELHVTGPELEALAAMMRCSPDEAVERLHHLGAVVSE